jgi:protein-L-isoaspartate(D-aspartate) O-methyltransferase
MSADFAAQRENMVESQVRTADVTDHAIQDAMRAVQREALLAPEKRYSAYADAEVEYAPGRWLLKPRDVAKLLQALRPRPGERALAIAAPYAAAVLKAVGLSVDALDGDDLSSATVGDYDVIICEGGVATPPPAWTEALGVGGRLGVIEREGPIGRARLYLRSDSGVGSRDLFDAAPPILPGFEPARSFVF